MGLKELNLKLQYRSEDDDIVIDFYKKTVKEAQIYKRAVGYFSTQSLLLLGEELDIFINKDSRMKLIASPDLSKEDIELINNGYHERKRILETCILNAITLPELDEDKYLLSKIESMIAKGNLDIKIAFRNSKGIFHEKIGIIIDSIGDKIAFTGSMNETKNGYCENFESIDLYFSWDSRDLQRINIKEENFDRLWANQTSNLEIFDFTEVIRKKLLNFKRDGRLPEIEEESSIYEIKKDGPHIPTWLEKGIRPYQLQAYEKWVGNNYHGILQMATGTGKTITACYSLVKHYEKMISKKFKQIVIVIAPFTHLIEQWSEELSNFGYSPLKVYSDIHDWEKQIATQYHRLNFDASRKHMSIVTTIESFKSAKFQTLLDSLKSRHQVILVADEAHNLGAELTLKLLPQDIKYRLGLTATPIRHNDIRGTKRLIEYFDKIVFKYDLEDAIVNGFLTPYYYYPVIVYLDQTEATHLFDILNEFKGYNLSQLKKMAYSNTEFKEVIRLTYQIADGAINKFKAFKDQISNFNDTYFNLIYCSSVHINNGENKFPIKQIDAVNMFMGKELDMRVHTFTAQENIKIRKQLLERFSTGDDLQSLVAIRCLDEGVDIPATRRAFILSSSTNEKQFIQRRGRILRKSINKDYAEIYDFVTLPRDLEIVKYDRDECEAEIFIILKEYRRIIEFAKLAINYEEGLNLANQIRESYNLDRYLLQESE